MKRTALKTMSGRAVLAAVLLLIPAYGQSVDPQPGAPKPASSAVTPEQLGAWLHYIAAELRALRTEMLQLRLDTQEARVSRVEQEVRKARQRQSALRAEEDQHRQQIVEANELARQPLEPEQRNQLEIIRAELAADSGDRLRVESAEAVRVETELMQRLLREKEQYNRIQALLTQMTPGSARQ